MAGLIRVTPTQLHTVSGQLRSGASTIEGTLSQLAGQVAPLGSDWAGKGQARFQQLWVQWHTASKQLHQALVDISALMTRAATAYETNDAQVGASFK